MAGLEVRSQRLTAPKGFFLSGDHNVALQYPLWGKGDPVRYWAENGLVKWEDAKDGSYGSMMWSDCAERALALHEMIFNSRDKGLMSDEIRDCQKFLEDITKVITQAKDQGGLEDWDDATKERKRRKPTSVMIPSVISGF